MERAAVSDSASAAVVFTDGLGERRQIADPSGNDTLELLYLRRDLSAVPSFEFALRERVGRLTALRHEQFGRARSVERLNDRDSTLAVVSDRIPGVRLSEMLENADQRRLGLDITTAIGLIGQLTAAVAALHESARDVAHGAIGPERIVITPNGRLVLMEYVLGAALEQLRFPRERYWSDLRVALPSSAGLPRFDQRADVTQIGVVALSLILGRPMRDDEFPARVADVVASTWAVSPRGGFEPLPAGLRHWLGRALQFDVRTGFMTASEARVELDKTLREIPDSHASPARLNAFLARYHSTGLTPPATVRPVLTLQPPSAPASEPVPVPPRAAMPPTSSPAETWTPPRGSAVAEVTPTAGLARPAGATPAARTPPASTHSPDNLGRPATANTPAAGVARPVQTTPPRGISASSAATPSRGIPVAPATGAVTPSRGIPVAPATGAVTPPRGTHVAEATGAVTPSRGTPVAPPLANAVTPAFLRTPVPAAPPPELEFQSFADAVTVKAPTPARGTPRHTARPLHDSSRPSHDTTRAASEPPRPSHDTPRSCEAPRPSYEQRQAVPVIADRDEAPSKWPKLAAIGAALLVLVAGGAFAERRYLTPAAPPTTGILAIATNPSGVQTLVDGQLRGVTPVTLQLQAGAHRIELKGPNGVKVMPVTIAAGTQIAQYIELPRQATGVGQLQVRTEPSGARVTVDGVARGTSPTTVTDLAPGDHAVLLESDLGSMKQTVTIDAGTTASLVAPLGSPDGAPLSGWVAISAPVEMQLFEKDRLLGTSRTDRIMVSAGRHDIDVVNEDLGYRVTRTVQVPAGKVATIALELPSGSIAINASPWAEVWIDGNKAGETPIGNLSLPIGSHDVVFRHPELGEQHFTAIVTLKSVARLSVDMRQK